MSALKCCSISMIVSMLCLSSANVSAQDVVNTTTQADGSKRVNLSLRNLFRKGEETSPPPTDQRTKDLVRALECQERNWQLLKGVLDAADTRVTVSPVQAYGVTVTEVFANLETEAPEWGFEVPEKAVPEVVRLAGLQPDPDAPSLLGREFPDGAMWLSDGGNGRWTLTCGQYFEEFDEDEP
ncbi:hypothetical protein [Xanthomonas citri]|uniref:hypothetical protein n=1 Tax=Xanthomonas citri TaxID=346 RepID=UPI0012A98904|nr:hypothetical protein [Xanthomonas citri]MCC4631526.1 hypothetical protein [Xanthomonas citri]QGL17341.1 hypothetical protein GH913_11445 [Xanthomonas citri pv. malvacearum]